jgi:phosphonate transport system substrate-binding protein
MRSKLYLILALVMVAAMALSACAPAATAAPAPTAAPAEPTAVPPTEAPTTVPPTAIPPTEAPTAVPPTAAPTAIPMVCTKLADAPTVKDGDFGSVGNPIVIAFVPSGDTGKITKAGSAIADCLAQMTGLSFKIEVGTSFAASIEAMGAEKAQVGFLNTFSILLAEQKYQIVPALANLRKYSTNDIDPDKALSGQMEPFYKGQFIAKVDSGIKTLADLKGKTFCFVDPNSTSGYIVPRIILKANGVDPDKDLKAAVNAGSHDKVGIAVYNGDCDAGVTYIDVLTDAAAQLNVKFPDITDKVKAFQDTDKIPNDGVQYIKSLDPKVQAAITEGLLAMAADKGGAGQLKALYNINGFQKIEPSFYDDFGAILKKAGVDPAELVK